VDRGNDLVAYLFEPLHPAVLRLIKGVIDAAHAQDISVTVCGEMASDLRSSLLLVGLGVDGLSMTPSGIPDVKRVIRDVSFDRLQSLAEDVLDMHVLSDIYSRVNEGLADVVGDVAVDEAVEEEV
jgi:phosphotransferase system enzyme I (PtsI)